MDPTTTKGSNDTHHTSEVPHAPIGSADIALHASDDVQGIIDESNKQIDLQYRLHPNPADMIRGFAYPVSSPSVWIKWGHNNEGQMRTESDMQRYVAAHLANLPDSETRNVRVPHVYRFITMERTERGLVPQMGVEFDEQVHYGLIVMEYVKGVTVQDVLDMNYRNADEMRILDYLERAFEAVNAVLSVPKPDGLVAPGPGVEGGGLIHHMVFNTHGTGGRAPRLFANLQELEDWANAELAEVLLADPTMEPVDFEAEGMKLCHCDLHMYNFMMPDPSEPCKPIYVIDFQHAAWLPLSFLLWEMCWKQHSAFQGVVRRRWDFNHEKNIKGLLKIASVD